MTLNWNKKKTYSTHYIIIEANNSVSKNTRKTFEKSIDNLNKVMNNTHKVIAYKEWAK